MKFDPTNLDDGTIGEASPDTLPAKASRHVPLALSHERIPQAVYEQIHEAGKLAAHKLVALFKGSEFDAFKPNEKLAAIRLAMDRAYGMPDSGIKRQIKVVLNAEGMDAVQASLNALSKDLLPEMRELGDAAKDAAERSGLSERSGISDAEIIDT